MARDGLVPSFLVQIHPRFHTPYNATLLSGGCATILTLMVDLEVLAALTSAGTLYGFVFVCAGVLLMRYGPAGAALEEHLIASDKAAVATVVAGASAEKAPAQATDGAAGAAGAGSPGGQLRLEPVGGQDSLDVGLVSGDAMFASPLTRDPATSGQLAAPLVAMVACGTVTGVVASSQESTLSSAAVGVVVAGIVVFVAMQLYLTRLPAVYRPRAFACPGLPLVPSLGMTLSTVMLVSLGPGAWVRFALWNAVGLSLYFGSARHGSKLRGGGEGQHAELQQPSPEAP